MKGSVLFFDVFNPAYLPVIGRVAREGFLPIMNATPVAEQVRASGLPLCAWEASIPAEIVSHVQAEVDRIGSGLAASLEDPAVQRAFSSDQGSFLLHRGESFFGQLFAMLANQIAALDIFDAVIRQHDLRLLVLGCDNTHVQRVLVDYARQRGIPSLQLAHAIYAPLRVPVAGEMHRIYADRVAAFGQRGRDVLVALGNAPERIVLTGAPVWDGLYVPEVRIGKAEARQQLGLHPDRPTVLLCTSYADGSTGFFPGIVRHLMGVYRTVVRSARDGRHHLGQDLQLVVRPHPHEFQRAGVSSEEQARLIAMHAEDLARQGVGDVHVVANRKIESIRAADVVIADGASSVIPEVMILERPVVMVPLPHQDPPVYTSEDGIGVVDDVEDLPAVLLSLLAEPERQRAMVRAQNAVLPQLNHGHDGRAGERVAATIERLVAVPAAGALWAPRCQADAPPLDVLLAVHGFLPDSRAGTELYTHDLARALQRRGHRVRVLHPRYAAAGSGTCSIEDGHYQGLPTVALRMGTDAAGMLRNEAMKPVLRQYLADHRPALVHVQHLLGLSVSFLEVLRDLDIPVVLTANDFWFLCEQVHLVNAAGMACEGPESVDRCVGCMRGRMGFVPDERLPELFHYVADRYYAHRAALQIPDLVICPSRLLLETFQRHGFDARRMLHIPQGTSLFTPASAGRREGDPVVFSYLGSIGYRKGLDLLVAAFNQVDTGRATLHVHGEIIDRAYFEGAMRSLAPGKRVRYHGGYGPGDLPGLLAATDVTVVPSRGENFPFVVRESLHAGVPVVAAAVGGIPEIVEDGGNGLLFASNDAQDLARKLALLIEQPEQIARLRRGIKPVKSIEQEAAEIERCYTDVLAERAGACTQRVDASIIARVCNRLESTERCLTQLASVTDGVDYEVIIVDDGSTDGTPQWLATLSGAVKVIRNERAHGLATARNQGARAARGRFLVFLDQDTVPRKSWLSTLVDEVEGHQQIAVVGSKLVDADGAVRHAGVAFSREEQLPYHVYPGCPADLPVVNRRREFQAVNGACMLVRREAFDAVGGFDESYGGYLADIDLCLKIREAGWSVGYRPDSVLERAEGWPEGETEEDGADADRLRQRWQHRALADEDIILIADGCARRSGYTNGRTISTIAPITDCDERVRWERVAEVQRLAQADDIPAAIPLLAEPETWPADESVLRWAALMCDRAGVSAYARAFRDRAQTLGGRNGAGHEAATAPDGTSGRAD